MKHQGSVSPGQMNTCRKFKFPFKYKGQQWNLLHDHTKVIEITVRCLAYSSLNMRLPVLALLVSLSSIALAAPANAPLNGEIVSACNDKTDLGQLNCLGDGFTTCTHRGNIFRPCAAGTKCTIQGGQLLCL